MDLKQGKKMYNNIIEKIQKVDYSYYRRDEAENPIFLTEDEIDLINESLDKIIESGSNIAWSFRYQLSYIILDTFYNNPNYFQKLSSEDKLGEELTELLYKEGIFFGEKCHYSIACMCHSHFLESVCFLKEISALLAVCIRDSRNDGAERRRKVKTR